MYEERSAHTPEPIYFVCPACGCSFRVAKESSARIFCSGACRTWGRT